MKVAVVGCGAVGSFYGAKLCRDRHDVHFLLRADYDVVRRRGVRVLSPEGDFHVQPRCAKTPQTIGTADVVLIGLKTTGNDALAELLPPLVSEKTAVLTLQNGLGNEDQLAKLFPIEQILGGLCFVCINRLEPGVIQHVAFGQITLGEYQRWPEPRTHDIASMFRHAGVPCEVTDNLERAHWEKLAWNTPFNGLGVASAAGYEAVVAGEAAADAALLPCLTTDRLLGEPRWAQLVRELMHEVISTAHALGFKVPVEFAEKLIERTLKMGAYRASTLIDFERGLPLELNSLFLEPLRRAKAAGVHTPRMAALCSVLEKLDAASVEQRSR
jgi:2-dehydropantoate 2-reductase